MLWEIKDEHSESEIEKRLLHQAIQDKEYLYILGIREWDIPIQVYDMKVIAATKRKIDVLKKVIMYTILNTKTTNLDQLSEFLHIDVLFITDTVNQLLDTGAVNFIDGIYVLTRTGHQQYNTGTVLSDPTNEEYSIEYSILNNNVIPIYDTNVLISDDLNEDEDLYRYFDQLDDLDGQVINEELFRYYLKQSGQVFEIGGNEKIISKIEPLKLLKNKYAKCVEFQLYDILENKAYARIWNGALSRWDETFEREINGK